MAKNLTGNTTIMGQGIIPFGSNDEAVLMGCSMKSAASVTDTGFGSVTGTPTFDSELGMMNTSDADHVEFGLITGFEDLDITGQLSFDVEIAFVASKHGGWAQNGNEYILTHSDADVTTSSPYGRIFKRTLTFGLQAELNAVDPDNLVIHSSASDTGRFVTITQSWNGKNTALYMDGRLIYEGSERISYADMFKYLWLGSDRGTATGISAALSGHYVKNFIISTRPVMFPRHPVLSNTVIVGHSFVASVVPYPVLPTVGSYGWDKDIPRCVSGYLANKGLRCFPTIHAESGAVLDTTIGAANDLDAEFTAAVALRPTCAIIIAGLNDVLSVGWDEVTFESEYKRYIDGLAATCDIIVVCTITTTLGDTAANIPTIIANKVVANTIINALPAYNSKCVVADNYKLFGETIGENYWNGEYTTLYDDQHPMPKACRMIGEDIGYRIYTALAKQ